MKIFFLGCQPAADMAFGFIHIQHLSDLGSQSRIYLRQALGTVLMYGRFANAIFLRRLTYGGIILYNIIRDLDRSFFNIIFQKRPLQSLLLHCMQGGLFLCLFYLSFKSALCLLYTLPYDFSCSILIFRSVCAWIVLDFIASNRSNPVVSFTVSIVFASSDGT